VAQSCPDERGLGSLPSGSSAVATVEVRADAVGVVTLAAGVSSDTYDPSLFFVPGAASNWAQEETRVVGDR
jgi:hypothetical protein